MLALQTMIFMLVLVNDFEFAVYRLGKCLPDRLSLPPSVLYGFQMLS
jgi:hypothetical protein